MHSGWIGSLIVVSRVFLGLFRRDAWDCLRSSLPQAPRGMGTPCLGFVLSGLSMPYRGGEVAPAEEKPLLQFLDVERRVGGTGGDA